MVFYMHPSNNSVNFRLISVYLINISGKDYTVAMCLYSPKTCLFNLPCMFSLCAYLSSPGLSDLLCICSRYSLTTLYRCQFIQNISSQSHRPYPPAPSSSYYQTANRALFQIYPPQYPPEGRQNPLICLLYTHY